MIRKLLLLFVFTIVAYHFLIAQRNTVGLTYADEGFRNTYTLFSPLIDTNTFLIDEEGYVVHSWQTDYNPANSVYLLDDGSLIRTGRVFDSNTTLTAPGFGGIVQKLSWSGAVIWEYKYSNDTVNQHHDIQPLPNGNILILAWVRKTAEQAIAMGRNPEKLENGDLWPERIIEVKPVGNDRGEIVWQWDVWDHLIQDFDPEKPNYGVISEHPEKIDINYFDATQGDWQHVNAISYNQATDQIILSVLFYNEIWIIDHSTTTEEAKTGSGGLYGKGGDLLYRWGNDSAFGLVDAEQKLFGTHDTKWVSKGLRNEGQIMFFHNGNDRSSGESYSSIDFLDADPDGDGVYEQKADGSFFPDDVNLTESYVDNPNFYSRFISGAQVLSNGNLFICSGAKGRLFEVDLNDRVIWEYINPVTPNGIARQGDTVNNNIVFRADRISPDHPALAEKDLSRKGKIELELLASQAKVYSEIYPNPAFDFQNIKSNEIIKSIQLFDINGKILLNNKPNEFEYQLDVRNLQNGLYYLKVNNEVFKTIVK